MNVLRNGQILYYRQNGSQYVRGNTLGRPHRATFLVEAFHRSPIGALRETLVNSGSCREMPQTRFLNIFFHFGVRASRFSRDELLRRPRGHAKIEHQRLARKIVDLVFEMLDPRDEAGARGGSDASRLMRKVRADVAVRDYNFAFTEGGFEAGFGFEPIAGVQQRSEVWVHGVERPKIAVEKLADHFAEPRLVLRKAGGNHRMTLCRKRVGEQLDLRPLAAAVDSFHGDEFSRASHCGRQSNWSHRAAANRAHARIWVCTWHRIRSSRICEVWRSASRLRRNALDAAWKKSR